MGNLEKLKSVLMFVLSGFIGLLILQMTVGMTLGYAVMHHKDDVQESLCSVITDCGSIQTSVAGMNKNGLPEIDYVVHLKSQLNFNSVDTVRTQAESAIKQSDNQFVRWFSQSPEDITVVGKEINLPIEKKKKRRI
jgi:hypothetical protein